MTKKILLLSVATLLLTTAGASAQILLSGWTFETSQPTAAGPFAAENGTLTGSTALGVHAGASTYSSPAGNGSAHSFSSNGWAIGDYYQFTLTNVVATELFVTFGQYGSSTGPANFSLSYSVNGGPFTATTANTYTVLGSPTISTTTYNPTFSHTFDLTGLAATGVSVVFRLVDTSTTAISSANPVATTGTSRVDDFNVSLNGPITPAPEPSTYACLFLGGAGLFVMLRSRRRTA